MSITPFEIIKEFENLTIEDVLTNKKLQNQGLNIPVLIKIYSLSKDTLNQRFAIDLLNLQRIGFYQDKLIIFGLCKYLPNNETLKNEKIYFLKPILQITKYKPSFKDEQVYENLINSFPSVFKGKSYKEIDEILLMMLKQRKYREFINLFIKSQGVEFNKIISLIKEFVQNNKHRLIYGLDKFIEKYINQKYIKENKDILTKTGKFSQTKMKEEFKKDIMKMRKMKSIF